MAEQTPLDGSPTAPLGPLAGGADRIVVLDCETTGLYNSDRIVEVAAVTLDLRGQVHDIFETLVQPERDVSASHIHKITASMVADAPTFGEVAAELAIRLNGACVCAHNLPFDARMVSNEFERVGGSATFSTGLDTLRLSGKRLTDACIEFGIQHGRAHSALDDALATANLLVTLATRTQRPGAPSSVIYHGPRSGRIVRRGDMAPSKLVDSPLIIELAQRLSHTGVDAQVLSYLDVLDRAISDLHLDRDERAELAALAQQLGLSEAGRQQAHRRYLNELIDLVLDDHIVDDDEFETLLRIAAAFELERSSVDRRVASYRQNIETKTLQHDEHVVITGEHSSMERSEIQEEFERRGWTFQTGVRKNTTVVALADPSSESSKARTARQRGIQIVVLDDLIHAGPGDIIACVTHDKLTVITCPKCLDNWTVPYQSGMRREQACSACR